MRIDYKEYQPEVLKRLQEAQLVILKDFIQVCEQNELEYIIVSGTAIGAIRHKGFIPWDDDVDVAMPRSSFDRFVALSEESADSIYEMKTPLLDRTYTSNVPCWQRRGTRFVPYPSRKMKSDLGIGIDIFPIDNMPDDEKERKKLCKKAWRIDKLIFLCNSPTPVIPWKGLRKKIGEAICFLAHYGLKVFHVSPVFLYKKLEKVSRKYNDVETKAKCIYIFTDPYASRMTNEELYPFAKATFVDVEVNLPGGYDTWLRRVFGDYMKLPPEEKRRNHCPYILDFGDIDTIIGAEK